MLEGPVTNVWWRIERVLYTPALELGILAGVTRATLMSEAATLGYEVREGAFPLEHAMGSEEMFTSSSVREVMPVVELDGAVEARTGPSPASCDRAQEARAAPKRRARKSKRVLSLIHQDDARTGVFPRPCARRRAAHG